MKLAPFHNTKSHRVTVGTKTVKPGETRMVEAMFLPSSTAKQADPVKAVSDPLMSILDLSVEKAKPALEQLSTAELELLETAEHNGNTRASMIQAIQKAKIDAASREAEQALSGATSNDESGEDTKEQNGGTGEDKEETKEQNGGTG